MIEFILKIVLITLQVSIVGGALWFINAIGWFIFTDLDRKKWGTLERFVLFLIGALDIVVIIHLIEYFYYA